MFSSGDQGSLHTCSGFGQNSAPCGCRTEPHLSCFQFLGLLSGPRGLILDSLQQGGLLAARPKGECLLLLLVSFQGSADWVRPIQDNFLFD